MAIHRSPAAARDVEALIMSNAQLWATRRMERPFVPAAAERLSEIRIPVMVVVGNRDLPHIKDIALRIVGGISGARLVQIPDAGHLVSMDAPLTFNALMKSFVTAR
jgi:pimeloyl-ACP methyl ester carboxylesterase